MSLEFFIDIILPAALWFGVESAPNINDYQEYFLEGKIKGGIEVTGTRGRRRRKLLDDLKEWRVYCHLKEEALDRTVWRAGFGRGFGPVVRQIPK